MDETIRVPIRGVRDWARAVVRARSTPAQGLVRALIRIRIHQFIEKLDYGQNVKIALTLELPLGEGILELEETKSAVGACEQNTPSV